MNDVEFEALISRALNDLPSEFLDKMENVNVVFQDWPNRHQVSHQRGQKEKGLLLGLYEGIPRTRRGNYGVGGPLPDKITIFKIPILMISKSYEEVEANVRDTVLHEIAHHFGIDDEQIKGIQKQKKSERG